LHKKKEQNKAKQKIYFPLIRPQPWRSRFHSFCIEPIDNGI